jgi:hypothetical protein
LTNRALAALDAAWTGKPVDLPDQGQYLPKEAWEPHFGPTLQRQAVKQWAENVLREWAAFEIEGRGEEALSRRPVLLEMAFRFEINDYLMIGRIDRVDEVLVDGELVYDVIDYKTGAAGAVSLSEQIKKFFPQRAEDTPSDYQLPIYALALQMGLETIQTIPRMLTYINLDRIEKSSKGKYRTEAMRSVQLLECDTIDTKQGVVPIGLLTGSIYDAIKITLDDMSSSPYPATPGFHCSMCGFRSACSRGQAYGG